MNTGEAQIRIVTNDSLGDSVEFVLSDIQQMLDSGEYENIALISRKRSQIIPYQIKFASNDLPFYAAEDLQVLLSGTFDKLKEMILFKAQAEQLMPYGPEPVAALLKFCNLVKRFPLSRRDSESVKKFILSKRPKSIVQAVEWLYGYEGPLKGANNDGAMARSFYESIVGFLKAKSVSDTIRALSDCFAGLQKDYGKSLDDIFYADPPFIYLADYASQYEDHYDEFLIDIDKAVSTLAKVPGDNSEINSSQDIRPWNCPLHLMTALRAKGKEFDAVYILDCNQGIYPIKRAETEAELESERRLFYVAMTRARKKLTFLVNREMFDVPVQPSQYLVEAGFNEG